MATGFISPGDLATGSGAPAGFTTRWGTGIAVVENVAALYDKEIQVDGDGFSLHSVDAVDGSTDVELVMLFRASNIALNDRHGIWTRVPSGTAEGAEAGYLNALFRTSVPDNRIQISEFSAGSIDASLDQSTNNWVEGTKYWMRVRANTSTLQVRFWADGGSEPGTWDLSATDSTYAVGGWAGFGSFSSTSSAKLYVEALGWATSGDTAPSSSSLSTPANFTLTSSSAVRQLDGSWNPVAEAGTYDWEVERDDGGTWVAFDAANTASTSFQLTDTDGVDWSTTYRARARAVPPVA